MPLIRIPTLTKAEMRSLAVPVCAAIIVVVAMASNGFAQDDLAPPRITVPKPETDFSIHVNASQMTKWREGQYEVFHASGGVRIEQGNNRYSANHAIIWHDANVVDQSENNQTPSRKLIVYLNGQVVIDRNHKGNEHESISAPIDRITDEQWFDRLLTTSNIHFNSNVREVAAPDAGELWIQAKQSWRDEYSQIQQVQYLQESDPYLNQPILISPQTGQTVLPQTQVPVQGTGSQAFPQGSSGQTVYQIPGINQPRSQQPLVNTRVRITPRQSTGGSGIRTQPSVVPGETIVTATGGIRVLIDSDELAELDQFGQSRTSQIIIEADNIVAWTNQLTGNPLPGEPARWEIYVEGNVEFIMGQRVVFAERMFYDATNRQGTILDVEMLTPVQNYRGLARLKAEVVQQLSDNNWQAFGAALTSSRLGVPRYWLQSQQLDITRTQQNYVNGVTGMPQIDPQTGMPRAEDEYFAESRNNRVYLAGIPIFYWPVIRTSLSNPSLYLERLRIGNDSIFGTHVITGWDMYQVLGIRNYPRNSNWIGEIGYLEERGLVLGTEFEYEFNAFLGIPGDVDGILKAWYVDDSGLDNLGRDRRAVPLEEDQRGRLRWTHQHIFSPGFRLQGEVGWLSDRNFLEQYYEREWDTGKDYDTGLTLLRNVYNQSFQLSANTRINDFFTQTSWLPRFDHYVIGQSLFNSNLVWHSHSHVGYGKFEPADAPTNPVDAGKFAFLDWETALAEGVRAGTRNELDLPFQLGAVRVTPYVLGDVTYWEEDLAGNDLTRLYGQTGVRTSLPMWRVDPTIHSVLFNLNGLAHKVTFDSEVLFADSSDDFSTLPLYDPLNDDSQEHFQRRFILDTFGGAIPARFDERFFALRSVLQGNVTSPSAEIADDLTVVKLGMRNRWQTKRGLPGEARIIDWIEFDIEGSFFPDAARDNFGSDFGMVNYDFAWHLGDRLSFLSDGYYDFFSQGLRTTSAGVSLTRPSVGNLYVGVRSIEGPISSNILTAQSTYRMSDKWIFRGVSSYDFGATGNIGQSASVIRVGESFLVRFGVNFNASRGNVGFVFGIEPRFLPRPRLGTVGGVPILPASTNYLE